MLFVALVDAHPEPTDRAIDPPSPFPDAPAHPGLAVFINELPLPAEDPDAANDKVLDWLLGRFS